MKVYAEYFEEQNGNYRKKTLLCFGNSTDLLGSAVLMNPGSANVIGEINDLDSEFIKSFYSENHKMNEVDLTNWKIFRQDPTMSQLEKIFNGWYLGKGKKLNGVIQLFNCFYYKEQNFKNAIKNLDTKSYNYIFNEFIFVSEKPVYFGWGNAGKFGELKPLAVNIFSEYELNKTPIYNPNFESNCFYHPRYINSSYTKDKSTQKLLNDFYNLFQFDDKNYYDYIPYQKKFDIFFDKIKEYYKDKIFEGKNDNSKTIRIELQLKEKTLQLTVTKQEEGYCAIRLKDYRHKDEKDEVDEKIILFLKEQGYFEQDKVWFGVKKKEELDILDDGEDIFKQITSDINGLKDL